METEDVPESLSVKLVCFLFMSESSTTNKYTDSNSRKQTINHALLELKEMLLLKLCVIH